MKFSVLLFIILSCSCASLSSKEKESNRNAKTKYLSCFNYLEYMFDYDENNENKESLFNGDKLESSIEIIEKLTTINSFRRYQFEVFVVPVKYNFRDWKEWYLLNQNRIYLDENDSIFIQGNVVKISRNPKAEFNFYVSEIQKMINEKNIFVDEFEFLEEKILKLTGIDLIYDWDNKPFDFLKKKVIELNKWFKHNKNKLYWDENTQEIKLLD